MKKKLNKVAKDTNLFLKKFIFKQKKTDLLNPIKYGLLPGGKKIRSKLRVYSSKQYRLQAEEFPEDFATFILVVIIKSLTHNWFRETRCSSESTTLPIYHEYQLFEGNELGRSNENLHLAERTWHMSSKLTALTNKEWRARTRNNYTNNPELIRQKS